MRIKSMIGWSLVPDEVWLVMHRQETAIAELRRLREIDQLEYTRNLRDLITQFRLALEQDDQEAVREALDAAIVDMSDQVARTEEHLLT
jgi:hypothetical protein